jgi:deoxyribonuclease V
MHRFDVTPKEAVAMQKELRARISLVPLEGEPGLIGGCDVSMNRFATEGFAGFVVLNKDLEVVDHAVIKDTIPFPYVPGLLSFREIPMLMKAWEKLKTKPDLLVADGVGIAHPRRLGIATHLGLMLNIPTIGCAKSVLTGVYKEPDEEPGNVSYMHDPKTKEVIGAAVRTKLRVKPVFISPGHLITLEESIKIIKRGVIKYRLPEYTRQAHLCVNEYRMRELRS